MSACLIEECTNKYYGKGYCSKHYYRFRKYGSPEVILRQRGTGTCSVKNCLREYKGKGFCQLHLRRWKSYGDINKRSLIGMGKEAMPKHLEGQYTEEEFQSLSPWTKYILRKNIEKSEDKRFGPQLKKRKTLPVELIEVISEEEYHSLSTEERRFIRNPLRNWSGSIPEHFTFTDYIKMYESQNGLCKICLNKEAKSRNTRLSIDHCHKSGKIRGLLCSKCNNLLGIVNDRQLVLENALAYLRGEL